jgi:hypothetical protein
MKRLLLLALAVCTLSGQIEPPVLGVAVRENGRLDRVEGVRGALQTRTLRDGISAALQTPLGIFAQSGSRTLVLNDEGEEVAGWAAQNEIPHLAASRDGRRLLAVYPDAGLASLSIWREGELPRWDFDFPIQRKGALAAVQLLDDGRVRLAWKAERAIEVENLDPRSGISQQVGEWEDAGGPVSFTRTGDLVRFPAGLAESRIHWLADGSAALASASGCQVWHPESGLLALPAADEDALKLTWRKTIAEEFPVADPFPFPAAAPGAPAEARFRVRNTSNSVVRVFRLVVDGGGFQLFNEFTVPKDLAPNEAAEFWIRHAPSATSASAGRLRLNDRQVTLEGTIAPVTLPEAWISGQWAPLSTGSANRLDDAERGKAYEARLRLRASSGEPETPVIAGGGFTLLPQGSGEWLLQMPVSATGGMKETVLTVSGRSYRLQVFVMEPAPPRPSVKLPESSGFARQENVEVLLSEPARSAASGLLTIQFRPESPAVADDATLGLLPTLSRTISFQVDAGASKARFGDKDSAVLQTGTTAGSITVTASLGGVSSTQTLRLPATPPGLQSATVQALDQRVTLRLTGYDPRRDLSKVAFTFYLRDGQTAVPGRMEADLTAAFRSYFAEQGNTGGAFVLHVQFPVSGTISELAGLEVEAINGTGTARSQRLAIQ